MSWGNSSTAWLGSKELENTQATTQNKPQRTENSKKINNSGSDPALPLRDSLLAESRLAFLAGHNHKGSPRKIHIHVHFGFGNWEFFGGKLFWRRL